MVVSAFLVVDKVNWVKFFEKTFLMANVSPKVVLGMPFLTLSDVDVDFLGPELCWRTYTIKKVLPTTRRIKLVGKKEFTAIALDLEYEIYVVDIGSVSSDISPNSSLLNIYSSWRPQIFGLITKEALTKVPAKYSGFADIFSLDLAFKLLEHTEINDHNIELVNDQQPPYGPISSLETVELKTLKAYIETNLANNFIRLLKSSAGTPILFEQKSDNFFQLCINYRGHINLMIKNRYPLPLIGGSLDKIGRVKRFTQLDLTSAYYQMRIRKGNKWKSAFRTQYNYFM